MKRNLLSLLGLAALLTLGGCHSAQLGRVALVDTARDLRTRDEVLRTLGGPDEVAVTTNGVEALSYFTRQVRGSSLGIGYWGLYLFVGEDNVGTDAVTFQVGPDGRVRECRVGEQGTATLERGFWPF